MVERFKELLENRHQYAKDWKARTGGKVLGYFCTYVPEEIIYAANILPVRILGSHEPENVTQPHIYGGMYCPFCRDCLAQGLKGRFDYLDGVMMAQSCLHIRQAFWSWRTHIPTEYNYMLYAPLRVQSPRALPYLAAELDEFKKSLEEWIGQTISDAALDEGIEIVNTNRRLMRQVYETRKAENPPLTGVEAMQMVVSSQFTDKREHNRILEEVLQELPGRQLQRDAGARLMILGSEDDDSAFLDMVESLGATFVIDDHCTGSRYFWNEVIPGEERLRAIAARYLDRVPCPNRDWEERKRVPHILELARDWGVQGAVLIQQKFCDPHECDIPAIKQAVEGNDIPTLFLEFDVTVPLGQFRTRVEAFLEMLQLELV